MNYSIKGVTDQALAIDKLKSAGAEVIQSSDGLVCKSKLAADDLKKTLGTLGGVIEPIADVSSLSPDVRRFLAG